MDLATTGRAPRYLNSLSTTVYQCVNLLANARGNFGKVVQLVGWRLPTNTDWPITALDFPTRRCHYFGSH